MKIKKILSMVLTAALALTMMPAISTEAADIKITTNAGSGSLIGYYGGYVYYDYANWTDYTKDCPQLKSMDEGASFVSGDTVGHVGHLASRDGYGFAGWSEKENGDVLDLTTYKITKSITLYPVWSQDYAEVTIKGGRYTEGTFKIAKGASLKETGMREAFDKVSGYTFKGFSTKKGSKKVIDLNTYKVTKDVTLYPVYSGLGKTIKDYWGNKYAVTGIGSWCRGYTVEFKAPKNKNVSWVLTESSVEDGDTYYYVEGIASKAFKDCKNLKKVTIQYPDYIGANVFEGCDNLTDVGIVGYGLSKSSIKNCFKNSNVTTIHTTRYNKDDFKKVFTKKATGAKSKIKIVEDFIGF